MMQVPRGISPLLIVILQSCACKSSAQPWFVNSATEAGISHMHHSASLVGAGVAVFDYNNDGLDDIYLTGGMMQDRLYRNNGNGTFTDVSVASGIGITAGVSTMGVVTADVNNNGFRDIVVTTEVGESLLFFRNNGNGTFTRLFTAFGAGTTQRSVSATIADVNKDGLPDVYVVNYVAESGVLLDDEEQVIGFDHTCYGDLLFINNGGYSFAELSGSYGIQQSGCGLAAAFTDYDADGNPDLFVINDFGQWNEPNALYRNGYPQPLFEDVAEAVGVDDRFFGMGVAVGDYDRDGDLDYYATNIGRNYLYRNDGVSFTEVAGPAGVLNDSINGLNTTGWGCVFFDFDNDGHLDLFVSNGRIPVAPFIANEPDDPCKLYRNNGDGTFSDVTAEAGVGNTQWSRGAAVGDFNNDGRMDIVLSNIHEIPSMALASAALYINTLDNGNHWLKVEPIGSVSGRDAYGARVRVVANGWAQTAEKDGGSSHASQSTAKMHFGLGQALMVDSVIVRFPSGAERVMTDVAADQLVTVYEDITVGGAGTAKGCISGLGRVGERGFTISGCTPSEWGWSVLDMAGRKLASGIAQDSAFRLPEGISGMVVLRVSGVGGIFVGRALIP